MTCSTDETTVIHIFPSDDPGTLCECGERRYLDDSLWPDLPAVDGSNYASQSPDLP